MDFSNYDCLLPAYQISAHYKFAGKKGKLYTLFFYGQFI
jgi:hypothetical protein